MKTLNKKSIQRILCLILQIGCLCPAQYFVRQSVFGNGGVAISDTIFQIKGTLGQPAMGITSDQDAICKGGFWYQTEDIVSNIQKFSNLIPVEFSLKQNYPNPFNPCTTIQFSVPVINHIRIILFDMLGRELKILVNEKFQPGEYKIILDSGELPTGVYFYRLQSDQFSQTRKMLLLK